MTTTADTHSNNQENTTMNHDDAAHFLHAISEPITPVDPARIVACPVCTGDRDFDDPSDCPECAGAREVVL